MAIVSQVSDYSNGPKGVFCGAWVDSGNRCTDLAMQCHDTNAPAGYFLLISMSRVYDVN